MSTTLADYLEETRKFPENKEVGTKRDVKLFDECFNH